MQECDGEDEEHSVCNGGKCVSNRQSGIITSPNYPNNYPHSFDESHTIEVEEGEQIHLEFTDFVLESASNCRYDYVEGFFQQL